MRDLIVSKKNELNIDNNAEIKALEMDLSAMDLAMTQSFLSYIAQELQLTMDLDKVLSSDMTYVLNVPKDLKDGLALGKFWFTQKTDTGEKLASIMRMVDGKKSFFKNLTVNEVPAYDDLAIHQLTDGMFKMTMQQQVAMMSVELENIHKSVERMEKGMKSDRFGKITGAQELLRYAMKTKDEETRKSLTLGAVQSLTEGIGIIRETLKTRVEGYKAIPDKDVMIYWKMLMYPGNYKQERDREFDEIQDYFNYYEKAVDLLSCASLMVNEPEAMKEVFRSQKEFLTTLDMKGLKSIRNLHPDIEMDGEWFMSPDDYLDTSEEQFKMLADGDYEYLAIELTGEQLKEVLDHEDE